MSTRTSRVEELLRREIADLLLRGDLRDRRLRNVAAISITGVSVSGDLSIARVFVDVHGGDVSRDEVVKALVSAAGVFRSHVGRKVRLRRVPELRFEGDSSIERGASIERVLAELHAERGPSEATDTADDERSADAPLPDGS